MSRISFIYLTLSQQCISIGTTSPQITTGDIINYEGLALVWACSTSSSYNLTHLYKSMFCYMALSFFHPTPAVSAPCQADKSCLSSQSSISAGKSRLCCLSSYWLFSFFYTNHSNTFPHSIHMSITHKEHMVCTL